MSGTAEDRVRSTNLSEGEEGNEEFGMTDDELDLSWVMNRRLSTVHRFPIGSSCHRDTGRQTAGMVRISIDYQGDLHCQVTHEPSGSAFQTDAPKDNQGRGETFSPTDLVATALGSCMATTMGIVGRRHGIELDGVSVTVDKEMTSEGPRKIERLTTHIHFPFSRDADPEQILEKTALGCPVYLSISDAMEKPVEFHWKTE
jgi:uncharacterized OsmC-like protein